MSYSPLNLENFSNISLGYDNGVLYYNDLSLIFSDKPHHKITILDKFKNILEQDNVLDPQIKKLKMNKFKMNLKLVKEKNLEKNIDNNKIPNKANTNISNTTKAQIINFFKQYGEVDYCVINTHAKELLKNHLKLIMKIS